MIKQCCALATCLAKPRRAPQGPLSINVEINNSCNLDCQMCQRAELQGPPAQVSLDDFRALYAQIKAPYVALHGYGEPLLHPQLGEILREAQRQGARTSTTTNAILLTPDRHGELLQSGLGLLKVSLDSHVPQTYARIRGVDVLPQVVENIRSFEQARVKRGDAAPKLRLSYTILPANYEELPEFVRFARETLAQRQVYFQLLLFRNSLLAEDDLGEMTRAAFRQALERALAAAQRVRLQSNLPDILKHFDASWRNYVDETPAPDCTICLKPWLTCFISAGGDVKPCDLLGLSGEVMGNIHEQSFAEIWNGPRYQAFRSEIAAGRRPNAVCRDCHPQSLWGLIKYTAFAPSYLRE